MSEKQTEAQRLADALAARYPLSNDVEAAGAEVRMTQNDIIQMARKAGMSGLSLIDIGYLERFHALAIAAAPKAPATGLNLNCKSEQKRLASMWGFVPAQQPLTEKQIVETLMPLPVQGTGYFLRIARAIERAHGIK